MSNFFNTVRSLQESNWSGEAHQMSRIAHDASRSARDYVSHNDAHAEHSRAANFHKKAAAQSDEGGFTQTFHNNLANYHDAMSKLHADHIHRAYYK